MMFQGSPLISMQRLLGDYLWQLVHVGVMQDVVMLCNVYYHTPQEHRSRMTTEKRVFLPGITVINYRKSS